jgi:hypothetical protein
MADAKITALGANTTPLGTDIIPIVDDPGGTPVTQKITLTDLGVTDGWIHSVGSWSYASASTITIPSGGASLYQKGDRIRWKQGAGYKYGVIVTVADTLLTIAVNTDYTVANSAITDMYYSHQVNPIGYPTWFSWTPTLTSQGGAFTNNPVVNTAKYSILGKTIIFLLNISYHVSNSGGSGSTRATLPITPIATVSAYGLQDDNMYAIGAKIDQVNNYLVWQKYDGSSIISNNTSNSISGIYEY